MADEIAAMLEHAAIYLESARANAAYAPRMYPVAYDEARHCIELAGKILLLHKTGDYPKRGRAGHRIGDLLARNGLIPSGVDLHDLNRALDHHTRGAYGFFDEFTTQETQDVIGLAETMLNAATIWPHGDFQPGRNHDF